jgi:hypothetical protein
VLPDILRYDRTQPAHYPNGRVPSDDVYSMRFAWLSHGKIPPTGLKPHHDLLSEFPYLGPRTPSGSVRLAPGWELAVSADPLGASASARRAPPVTSRWPKPARAQRLG